MKNYFNFLLCTALTFSVVSCSDKDDEPNIDGKGTMEQYTPEQSKKYLEETASEAMNMLNPDDQKAVIELCSFFSDVYGDYSFPENFEIENEADKSNTKHFMQGMANAASHADVAAMSRYVTEYIYSIDFDKFKGVYEPNKRHEEWEKSEDSNDIIFRFDNATGATCELKISGSSKYSSGTIDWADESDYYTDSYVVDFKLPTEITLSLKEDKTELISGKINSEINVKGHAFNLNVNLTVANIHVEAKMSGTDANVSEFITSTVGGKQFIISKANVTGNHLCDVSFYDNNFGDDYDNDENKALSQLLKEGKATVNLINKVSVDGTFTASDALWDALDLYAESSSEAQSYVTALNNSIKATVRYNNTTTEQASVIWEYAPNDWDEYDIEPLLLFPDKTTYHFTDYFESGFTSVENLWNSLTRKYKAVWNSVR